MAPSGGNIRVTDVELKGSRSSTTTVYYQSFLLKNTEGVHFCSAIESDQCGTTPATSIVFFCSQRRLSQLNNVPPSISVEARQTLAEQVRQICQCINFCCRTSEILMFGELILHYDATNTSSHS